VNDPETGALAGKLVVVTGARGGQGLAEAYGLASAGATVVAVDAQRPEAADGIEPIELDVTDETGWRALAAHIDAQYGRVDGLVNNAGVAFRTQSATRLEHLQVERWNRTLAVNVTGPMLAMRSLRTLMTAGGSVLNVGSVAALTGHAAMSYATSKWALRGLTQSAATQLGPAGIRVNAIHPGYIETGMTADAPSTLRGAMVGLTPLGRPGVPEDLVAAVVFFMSDASSFITGAELAVDGGYLHGAHAMHIAAQAGGRSPAT